MKIYFLVYSYQNLSSYQQHAIFFAFSALFCWLLVALLSTVHYYQIAKEANESRPQRLPNFLVWLILFWVCMQASVKTFLFYLCLCQLLIFLLFGPYGIFSNSL